jgi:hypothetical protein
MNTNRPAAPHFQTPAELVATLDKEVARLRALLKRCAQILNQYDLDGDGDTQNTQNELIADLLKEGFGRS